MAGDETVPAGGDGGVPPVLAASGSHLYRGAQGSIGGTVSAGPCVVEFADGSLAFGQLQPMADRMALELGSYVTARGTEIPARRWALGISHKGGAARFRVLARLG